MKDPNKILTFLKLILKILKFEYHFGWRVWSCWVWTKLNFDFPIDDVIVCNPLTSSFVFVCMLSVFIYLKTFWKPYEFICVVFDWRFLFSGFDFLTSTDSFLITFYLWLLHQPWNVSKSCFNNFEDSLNLLSKKITLYGKKC